MVNTTLKPYSKYKPSGIDWLGKVPAHWQTRRLKTVLSERVEKGFPDEPLLAATQAKGVVRKEQYENRTVLALKDLHLLKRVHVSDFVISLRSFQGGIEYAYERGIISPAYTVLHSIDGTADEYLARLFKSGPFIENLSLYVTGIREGQNIDYSKLRVSHIPLPPLDEQTAIVRYLDRADERIQRAISAKERLIELLTEQRQAVIHQAVTRGLDPNVRLKDSGIEWLGDMPEHWNVRRIKDLASPEYKSFVDGDWIESPYITDSGIRLIQTGNIGVGEYREQGYRYITQQTFKDLNCTEFRPGDILICRLGVPVARACLAPDLGTRMITAVDVCIFKPHSGLSSEFLVYQMSSTEYLDWVNSSVRGSTRDRISRSMLGTCSLIIPPLDEQTAIVRYLDKATANIDASIANAHRQIDLLREYRTRLIADVVTGQVDVRNAVVN